MALGALLKTFIYIISSSLLYPVLFLLVLLTVGMIFCSGMFFAEWLERLRLPKIPSEQLPNRIQTDPEGSYLSHRVRNYIRKLQKILVDNPAGEEEVENLLQDCLLNIRKSIDRLKILVRVAPGLGLIGTLIPMGTGLAALGQGDMSKLTSDLVIAFTTTVVGLALGLISFFFWTIKNRWVEEDIKNIELATEVLTKDYNLKDQELEINPAEKEKTRTDPVKISFNRQ